MPRHEDSVSEPQARLFVSSVINGFELFRAAAADGVRDAGMEPVRLNEDFSSRPESSRNACLDAVASCDGLVLVLGATAGSKAPSGKSVVEEEYDYAVHRGMPIYAFLQDGPREPEAERFAARVSDYVLGFFRSRFTTPDDLRERVAEALRGAPPARALTVDNGGVDRLLAQKSEIHGQPSLRLVLSNGRTEEWLDPLTIGSSEFQDALINVGAASPNPLFSLRKEKDVRASSESLSIRQVDDRSRHGQSWLAALSIMARGQLIVEISVGPKAETDADRAAGYGLVVQSSDLHDAARALFQASYKCLESIDKYVRYRHLVYNVALHGLGHAMIYDSKVDTSRGVGMRMSTSEVIVAYDMPRPITRDALARPDAEIERCLLLLKERSR